MNEWKTGLLTKFHVSERSLPLGRFTLHASRFTLYIPHLPILLILLLHFALALAYASRIPLGEAPDESAHLSYARFIADQGRLPATRAERQEAGYRSAWPPFYHFLIAGPLALIGDEPPARLKAVGDTPRRLIPTDGQTIAAFIHTADESLPWRGLPLAWHWSRLISVALTTLAVTLTYAIAWRLTRQRTLATSAAALHAFIPQVLFIGSILNDDNLLICLSGLIFLTLINYTQRPTPAHIFLLGVLLGLATVAKYNALPLWALAIIWLLWPRLNNLRKNRETQNPPSSIHYPLSTIYYASRLSPILLFCLGALLTGGWWFIFTWLNFNEVTSLGWLPGSLAALTAGASDASLRQIAAAGSLTLPPVAAWLEWFVTLFETFWGSFGGGSTIDLPTWVYWLLAIICLLALFPIFRITHQVPRTTFQPLSTIYYPLSTLFLLSPLFFLPLPMIRFALTGSLIETAQGRHLFPALSAITLSLVWGLSLFTSQVTGRRLQVTGHRVAGSKVAEITGNIPHISRLTPHTPHLTPHASRFALPLLVFLLSLYSLNLIQASYPPPLPLRTTSDAATAKNLLKVKLTESLSLIGYEVGDASGGVLPVTLVWQADSVPSEDYLVELTLTDETGQPIGGWLGHPLGGRYPTRAWDEGDVLRHTIPVPVLPGLSATQATLTLRLLDASNQSTTSTPLTLATNLPILQSPSLPSLPRTPAQLRADELPPDSAFPYRSTLSFVLPDTQSPELVAPTGQLFPPVSFLPGQQGSIAHFIVAANWPSGDYQLKSKIQNPAGGTQAKSKIENRPRQFDLPSTQYTLNANFADTLTLLGYDLPQRRVQPGAAFPLTLHWRAERTIGQHLIVFNHLLDQANNQQGGADRVPQLYYTTLLWAPNEIVSDVYNVPVAADAPPGVYWLDVGLYPSDQPTFSLPLFVDGRPIERNSVRLGPLRVGGPPPGVTVTTAQPQNPLNLSFDNQITLLGFDLSRANNNPKSKILPEARKRNLKLYWRADTIPTSDYTVFIHLLDLQGNLVAQFDSPPAAGAYPTSVWNPGEIIADEHRLGELPPGRYTLQVGLYRLDTGQRLPVVGKVDGAVKLVEFEEK
jgi:hypothetical protein